MKDFCPHIFEYVKKPNVDGVIQLRKQCTICTKLTSQSEKHSKVKDMSAIPYAVDDVSWKLMRQKQEKRALILKQKRDYQYAQYRKTEKWKLKRALVLKRDDEICQACLSARATEAHHKHYLNIFNEPLFDLIAICRPCHEAIHNYKPDDPGLLKKYEIKHTDKYLKWKK